MLCGGRVEKKNKGFTHAVDPDEHKDRGPVRAEGGGPGQSDDRASVDRVRSGAGSGREQSGQDSLRLLGALARGPGQGVPAGFQPESPTVGN